MQTIIRTEHLNLWYGEHQALHDLNMAIGANRITALIGPSGCGKTTFLKTINRMSDLVPNCRIEGSVQYNGKDIFAKDVDVTQLRTKIGMVFQKANPFPMSIYDNIAYGPRLQGIRSRAELDEIVHVSRKNAPIWDETKDRLKNPRSASPAGSSSGCVAPVRWRFARTCC